MISKITRKSFKKSKFLLFCIVLLFALSVAVTTILTTAYPVIETSYNNFLEDSNLEDFRFYTIPGLEEEYDKQFEDEFETKFNTNIEKTYYINVKEDDTVYGVNEYNSNNKINKIKLEDGKLPTGQNEILMTPEALKVSQQKIGDKIKIEDNDYKISGTGYLPDYVYPLDITSGNFSVGDNAFVPIYMSEDGYDELIENNNFYFRGTFNNKEDDTKEKRKEMTESFYFDVPQIDENGLPQIGDDGQILTKKEKLVQFIISKDFNPQINAFKSEIRGEKTLWKVIGFIITSIAIAMVILLFNNIFTTQKREIGIQKAEGVTKKELEVNYTKYLIYILLLASVLGILIGMFFQERITSLLRLFFYFPLENVQTNIIENTIVVIIAIMLIVILLTYFISIRRNLKKEPLLLIKNIDDTKVSKMKLSFLTKKLSFVNKYKVNILIRNLPMAILLAFGVFISAFLLLLGGMLFSATTNLLNNTYNENFKYDYEVITSPEKEVKEYSNNSIISKSSIVQEISTDQELNAFNSNVTLYAYNFKENDLINIKTNEKEKPQENNIYISAVLAQRYEMEDGGKITVQNPYKVDEDIDLTITGTLDDNIHPYIYMDINNMQNLFGLDKDFANGEVGKGNKKEEYLKYDKGATYNEKLELEDTLKKTTALLMESIALILFISMTVSFITLTVIVGIIIKKNSKTISTMKVLGYDNKLISKMTISPYKWILIIVYFVSIPVYQTLINIIINRATRELDISITINIDLKAMLVGFIAIIIVYYLSLIISKRKINKIDMAQSLKVDE